jgi:tetratricopeptide (TPR) repeat protein
VKSTPSKPTRYVSPEAHDAYLRGRYFLFAMNLDRSREYFERAIQLQPDYAAAWSGLSGAYGAGAASGMAPWKDVGEKAEAAAHKAVELDDSLAEAHTVLGATYLGEWNWGQVEEELRRAIELDPNDGEVHHILAYVLFATNHIEDGLREQKRASEIEPFARPWALGWAYVLSGRCDAAINDLRPWEDIEPQDRYIRFTLAAAYQCKGMDREWARELVRGTQLLSGEKPATEARHAFERGGRKGLAEWQLSEYLKVLARKQYVSPYFIAGTYALLGRREDTLRNLEDAYRERSARLMYLQNDPTFDFLHSDPRYRALVKKVGLPPAY